MALRRQMLQRLRKVGLLPPARPRPLLELIPPPLTTHDWLERADLSQALQQARAQKRRSVPSKSLSLALPVYLRAALLVPATYRRQGRQVTYSPLRLHAASRRHRLFTVARMSQQIRRQWRSVMSCYERSLKSNPKLKGRVLIKIRVRQDGRVQRVRLRKNELDLALALCLRARIKRWQFEPLLEGPVNFTLPLLFTSAR